MDKGSQWALHNARDEYGPMRTVVNTLAMCKGVMENPLCTHGIHLYTSCEVFVMRSTVVVVYEDKGTLCTHDS